MIFNPRVLQLNTSEQLRAELVQVGAEPSELDEQIARGTFRVLKLEAVPLTLARLLYQELVMEGGQVVTAGRLEHVGPGVTDVLLCGTRYQFDHLGIRLRWQASDELSLLTDEIQQALDWFERPSSIELTLGPTRFQWGARTYIMGILNVTPNSFSGDGLIQPGAPESDFTACALARARQLMAEGADILDIGGESSHPAADPVDVETELARVLPVVKAIAQELHVPISIDTQKPPVARAALQAGAHLINDVSGLQGDPEMRRVAAESDAALVLMHNGFRPERGTPPPSEASPLSDIIRDLCAQIETALEAGIQTYQLLLDPGVGFGKSVLQNLEILNRLREFKALGLPILIGPSRKGFISRTLDVPVNEREEGTATAVALGIAHGADLVRVHDVKVMARVAKMTDAIVRKNVTGER